jgi:hypothetical protein
MHFRLWVGVRRLGTGPAGVAAGASVGSPRLLRPSLVNAFSHFQDTSFRQTPTRYIHLLYVYKKGGGTWAAIHLPLSGPICDLYFANKQSKQTSKAANKCGSQQDNDFRTGFLT